MQRTAGAEAGGLSEAEVRHHHRAAAQRRERHRLPWRELPLRPSPNGGGAEASAPAQTVRTANNTAVTLPLLTKGQQRQHGRSVQALLNGLGHNAGTVDGLYGDNTAGAVKRFQLANSLAADGIVDGTPGKRLLGV